MNWWVIVALVFSGIQAMVSLGIFIKVSFIAGRLAEKVEQAEARMDRLEDRVNNRFDCAVS